MGVGSTGVTNRDSPVSLSGWVASRVMGAALGALGKPWGFKSQAVFLQACLPLWGHLCSAHGGGGGPQLPAERSRHACPWVEQRSIALGNLLGERGLGVIWGLVTPVGLSCGQ